MLHKPFLFIFLFIFSFTSFALSSEHKNSKRDTIIKFDDTTSTNWQKEFKLIEINSSADHKIQKAYFYSSTSSTPKPLIVSLHTWSGTYAQSDTLSLLSLRKNYNYIHPDFRGTNNTPDACGSFLTLSDIDDSIDFAIKNGNVDTTRIYVIGVSGGGYATLNTFMHSRHKIKKFSSWAAISDLTAWYEECTARGYRYAEDIYQSTSSKNGILDIEEAQRRSPIYASTPVEKLKSSELAIFAGIHDGVQGSVPFAHSIYMYNKLLKDLKVEDKSQYVSNKEIKKLVKYRKAFKDNGTIQDREICLEKSYGNIQLIIFNGGHEMLSEYAFKRLIE